MEQSYQDKLFDYMGALIYEPQSAQLRVDEFPPEYHKLVQGVLLLGQFVAEGRTMSEALAHGQLKNMPPISKDNNLAAPLKNLQAILNHITWQTQQVAEGDYSQQLDFMDDFSEAFNKMVEQLKDRELRIQEEADNAKRAAVALRQSQALMMNLAFDSSRAIAVLATDDGATLFLSPSAQQFLIKSATTGKQIAQVLKAYPAEHGETASTWDRNFLCQNKGEPPQPLYLSISSQPIMWEGRAAFAHIIEDVTNERQNEQEMRRLAYRDALTDAYNRRYGMLLISDLEAENRQFCISFVDIDYLKHCNDTYGHDAGNSYILSVTKKLQKVARGSVLCRIGGDEFMLIIPDTTAEEADAILSKLRQEFSEEPQEWDTGVSETGCALGAEAMVPHTFSYGSCAAGGHEKRTSAEALSLADERMYHFKFAYKKRLAKERESGPEPLAQ